MQDQKIENQFNLSLSLSESERERAYDLNTGFSDNEKTWEVIVRYNKSLDFLEDYGIAVTYLLGGYAVLIVAENLIDYVANLPEIEYMEKPKTLYYEVNTGKEVSCFYQIQNRTFSGDSLTGLTGRGTIVAVIDSGVDYRHPDFINPDNTTRILYVWDQTAESEYLSPPEGYRIGREYNSSDINNLLQNEDDRTELSDNSGHGTHVLGIAAGNGRASRGRYIGCAPESDIIVVKLSPTTSSLIQAIDYVVRKAYNLMMPVAINISWGNSYGSHQGDSLIEQYIENVSLVGRSIIVVGSGNEGSASRHVSGILKTDIVRLELAVYKYTTSFSVQLWKNYYDEFRINIIAPDGSQTGLLSENAGVSNYRIDGTDLLVYYGEPNPYSVNQEIYINFIPLGGFFDEGIWKIELIPLRIVSGEYNIWLPAGAAISTDTSFLEPVIDTSLTIPSTGRSVMTVGAYNALTDAIAPFSGRGYTPNGIVKPEIVAPGVDIISAAPGGGYTSRTGTSMATPFVTGAASCMMQWGIIEGNDPYLYGEKLKAYLIAGARKLPGYEQWPNPEGGWGALCVGDSIPY